MGQIHKSTAHSHKNGNEVFEEKCAICNMRIPEGKLVIRHEETHRIICLHCIVDIAEME